MNNVSVLHEVPTEVTENLKVFCIRFLQVLLCCFSFPKKGSNFLPMLGDETSLKSLEMHQLISETYVVCTISTERQNSNTICPHKGPSPVPQQEFHSDHTHLSTSAHKHCSRALKQQNRAWYPWLLSIINVLNIEMCLLHLQPFTLI